LQRLCRGWSIGSSRRRIILPHLIQVQSDAWTGATQFSDGRRRLRARLPQRMLQRECLDLHAGIERTARSRIRRWVAVTQHRGADEMRDQADIGDGRLVAAAEAPGARVAREHVLDRATGEIKPMPEPLHSRSLIEMKLLLEIFSHARDDEGMR